MELKKPHDNYHYDRMEKYFENHGEKNAHYLDDLSFFDLNLDRVQEKIDYTYTAPGSYRLYEMLRNPVNDNLEGRRSFIDKLKSDESLRNKLSKILEKTGEELLADYTYALSVKRSISPRFFYYVLIFNLVFLATIIYGLISRNSYFFLIAVLVLGLGQILTTYIDSKIKGNSEINYKAFGGVVEFELSSLTSLANIMYGASKIRGEVSLKSEVKGFIDDYDKVKDFSSNLRLHNLIKGSEILNAILTTFFKVNYLIYISTLSKLNIDGENILKLTKKFGEYDALLSIANVELYREGNNKIISTSNIIKDGSKKIIDVIDMVHPLVKDPVPNSIKIENESIIITGSNMSGKSTFLKALGINAVLSQVFGFSYCRSYTANMFNIMSSITPEDDITSKKSYFLSEAEAIKRLIDNVNDEIPSLYIIDEIFRGTNPEERIASSANIIDYLSSKNTMLLVSTHDLDMISLLQNNYKKIYFSEEITDKNIVFNYKINDGVAKGTNAVKVLELIGYPKEIIDKTLNLVNEIRENKKTKNVI